MAKAEPDIVGRTFRFAADVVRACSQLNKGSEEARILARQLIRSGTSVGANIEEAQAAQSKRDFISKYSIAL